MARVIYDDLAICVDCLMATAQTAEECRANGYNPDGLLAFESENDCAVYDNTDEDEDGFFSWRACDTCNSALGGTRYNAIALSR